MPTRPEPPTPPYLLGIQCRMEELNSNIDNVDATNPNLHQIPKLLHDLIIHRQQHTRIQRSVYDSSAMSSAP
jgi:hypothetical protein